MNVRNCQRERATTRHFPFTVHSEIEVKTIRQYTVDLASTLIDDTDKQVQYMVQNTHRVASACKIRRVFVDIHIEGIMNVSHKFLTSTPRTSFLQVSIR